ncbi:MAG: hypothetical protein F6K30_07995 [Cyanothece sp. SIO2G6]|nr:hypothetical protein [Cyanothece sp. SIO2G6]
MGSPTIHKLPGGTVLANQLGIEFVTVVIPQPDTIALVSPSIIEALQTFGSPLRWAITAVDCEAKTFSVEAMVVTSVPQESRI